MSDITKCSGVGCNDRDKCVRFTSTPSEYQSWFTESPLEGVDCDYFWDNRQTRIE